MVDVAAAAAASEDDLARAASRFERGTDLSLGTFLQLDVIVRRFAPDLIIFVGRSPAPLGDPEIVHVGGDDVNVLEVDFEAIVGGAQRVFIWWDATDGGFADAVLGRLLPTILGSREHLVAVQGVKDSRDTGLPADYPGREEPMTWWLGELVGTLDELPYLYDFLTRNGIEAETPWSQWHELRASQPSAVQKIERGDLAEVATTSELLLFELPRDRSVAFPHLVPSHHPAFAAYTPKRAVPEWTTDYLGVRTRSSFNDTRAPTTLHMLHPRLPGFDEEYFEWVDVLEAVERARGRFTMVELGAGWGRWVARGGIAARLRNLDVSLVAVEAEPSHFRWLEQHLRDNGLLACSSLHQVAVAAEAGRVRFHVGDPQAWYGQAIDPNAPEVTPDAPMSWKERLRSRSGGGPSVLPTEARDVVSVRAATLGELLATSGVVDLIDADIQGAEGAVFTAARDVLRTRVRMVHIGTHSRENEATLRSLFTELGWKCRWDFRCLQRNETPFGEIEFQDGVQGWENPALRAG